MRIGLIVSTFPPYQGGMGNMAWSYALGLSRRGHDVEVFCPAVRGGLERELDAPFAIRRLRPWVRFRNSAFIPQLAVRMGGFDAGNLHYPFYGGAEAIFALKTIKGKKLPLVVNFQMDNFGAGAAGLAFKANAAVLTTRLLSAADKVIVTSADYAAHSAAALAYEKFPAKFAAIPPGVDRTRFNPGPKDQSLLGKYGISAGEKVVLFVGGLDRAHAFKGVGFLLEAWRSLEPGRAR